MLLPRLILFVPIAAASAGEFVFGDKKFTVADEFVIERAMTAGLVERPIEVDFDERGNLYVTEASGTNDKVEKQLADKPHRVLRLTDSDGDGVFDQRTVFADGLMLPEGCMWMDGSLFVSAPPQIWKLTDSNDDGIADRHEVWFDGKTLTGCANDLHGPYRGPDGWIYWCKGAFAEQTHTLADGREFKTRASHIFRRRPEGGPLEPVITGGMDNPVGLAWTRTGEMILSCTFFQNPAGGQRDGLIHAIHGSVYGKQHNVLDGHPRTSPELSPVLTHLGAAAPCGIARADSSALGFRDQFFTCCFNLHKVVRSELVPNGATFTTRDHDFVVSDSTDFHPTDVIEGKDGSLLVVDTGGWYKLCCPTSQLHKPEVAGGIYRIRRREKDVATKSIESPMDKRLREVWAAIGRPGEESRSAVRATLSDADETVRVAAAHGVSLWRDRKAVPTLGEFVQKSDSPLLRRVAAEALGRSDDDGAIAPLLIAVERESDPAVQHALRYALLELHRAAPLQVAFRDGGPRIQQAAMIALAQMPEERPNIVERVTSADPLISTTAAWLCTLRPDWRSEAAERVIESALETPASELRKEVRQLLDGTPLKPEPLEKLISLAANDPARRGLLLELAVSLKLEQAPPSLLTCLDEALSSKANSQLRVSALKLISKQGAILPADLRLLWLRRILNDSGASSAIRVDALRGLPDGTSVEPDEFSYAHSLLADEKSTNIRSGVLQALGRFSLSAPQLDTISAMVPGLSAGELTAVLPAYASSKDAEVGRRLAAALEHAASFKAVPPDVIERVTKGMSAEFRSAIQRLKPQSTSSAEQKARLDELLAQVSRGDIRRGQAIFNSPRSACTTCHAMGYLGGTLGPDLTRIGQIRNERDLLEAIIYPSASFVRSYEPTQVKSASGEMLGIVRGENAQEFTLAVAPGAEIKVRRSEVISVQPAITSLMPLGFDGILKADELGDLVAFLKSLK